MLADCPSVIPDTEPSARLLGLRLNSIGAFMMTMNDTLPAIRERVGGKFGLTEMDVAGIGLARYYALLRLAIQELALTEAEARYLMSILGDTYYLQVAESGSVLLALEADEQRARWCDDFDVSAEDLMDRIRKVGAVAEFALMDAAERFWRPENNECLPADLLG